MEMSPVAKKLRIKEVYKICVLYAPEGYTDILLPLPEGVEVDTELKDEYDIIQIYVQWQRDLEPIASKLKSHIKKDGAIWFCYPKGTSKIETDLSRDKGWDSLKAEGMEICSLFAVDDKWSCARFKYVK